MSSDEGSSPVVSEGQGWDEFALCNAAGSSATSATAACLTLNGQGEVWQLSAAGTPRTKTAPWAAWASRMVTASSFHKKCGCC